VGSLTPCAALVSGKTYEASITAGDKHPAGNAFAQDSGKLLKAHAKGYSPECLELDFR
jgi:hypothetical protein